MATETVEREGTGTIALTTTIADNWIELGDGAGQLDVKLKDSAEGTFAILDSTSSAELDYGVWITVYVRGNSTGAKKIYFAASSGTPTLHYRVVSA